MTDPMRISKSIDSMAAARSRLRLLGLLAFSQIAFSPMLDAQSERYGDGFVFREPKPVVDVVTTRANAKPGLLDAYEYNGFMTLGGRTMASVFDAKSKRSFWLVLGEANVGAPTLSSFLDGGRSIVLSFSSETRQLPLKATRIQSLPETGQEPSSLQNGESRLLGVSEEIRRRRAERRAAMELRRKQELGN